MNGPQPALYVIQDDHSLILPTLQQNMTRTHLSTKQTKTKC